MYAQKACTFRRCARSEGMHAQRVCTLQGCARSEDIHARGCARSRVCTLERYARSEVYILKSVFTWKMCALINRNWILPLNTSQCPRYPYHSTTQCRPTWRPPGAVVQARKPWCLPHIMVHNADYGAYQAGGSTPRTEVCTTFVAHTKHNGSLDAQGLAPYCGAHQIQWFMPRTEVRAIMWRIPGPVV